MNEAVASHDLAEESREVSKEAKGALQSIQRLLNQLGPIRLGSTLLFLIFAVFVARYSWSTPLIQEAERALHDLRVTVFAPVVEKDDRIVMIVYNEETLKLIESLKQILASQLHGL